MKLQLALILSFFPVPASAQYYGNEATAPTVYMPYEPPVSYQTFGTTTYGSDGTIIQRQLYGNSIYVQPPNGQPQVVCQTFGNTTTCQ